MLYPTFLEMKQFFNIHQSKKFNLEIKSDMNQQDMYLLA